MTHCLSIRDVAQSNSSIQLAPPAVSPSVAVCPWGDFARPPWSPGVNRFKVLCPHTGVDEMRLLGRRLDDAMHLVSRV